jgi:hypothetical protein
MKRSTQKSPRARKDTHLIVLAAVAAFVALLLFLDAFVPVIPDGKERPDREEEKIEEDKEEEETQKHWWQGIFGRDEPVETDRNGSSIYRPDPSEQPYYTEEEMTEWYHDALTSALRELASLEARGDILPIKEVGLFNADIYGTPEVILLQEMGQYMVCDLNSLETLVQWNSYQTSDKLAVWAKDGGGYTALFTHSGDGDDRYVCELESTDRLRYMERTAMIRDGEDVTYRCDGRRTGQSSYEKAVKNIEATHEMMENTALRLIDWQNSGDMSQLAKDLLSGGQRFPRTDRTEP